MCQCRASEDTLGHMALQAVLAGLSRSSDVLPRGAKDLPAPAREHAGSRVLWRCPLLLHSVFTLAGLSGCPCLSKALSLTHLSAQLRLTPFWKFLTQAAPSSTRSASPLLAGGNRTLAPLTRNHSWGLSSDLFPFPLLWRTLPCPWGNLCGHLSPLPYSSCGHCVRKASPNSLYQELSYSQGHSLSRPTTGIRSLKLTCIFLDCELPCSIVIKKKSFG